LFILGATFIPYVLLYLVYKFLKKA